MRARTWQMVVVASFLALAGLACAGAAGGVQTGEAAPDFTLATTRGKEMALSSFRGRPVVLNFFTTWCAPCRAEMPGMQAVYERYAVDGLVLLAVDLEDAPAEVAAYGRELGLSFPLLMDEQGRIGDQYGVNSFPRTFFIDTEGVVRKISIGSMAEAEIAVGVEDLLDRARAAKDPPGAGGQAGGVEGCVNVGSALARGGPGRQHPGVMRLEHGACLAFDARSADGAWLRLAAERAPGGKRLWVTADFIDLCEDARTLPVE